MKTALSLAGIVLMLSVAFAVLWAASAFDRLCASARVQVETIGPTANTTVASIGMSSYYLRNNWIANTDFQKGIQADTSSALSRAGNALERTANAVDRVSVSASDLSAGSPKRLRLCVAI